MKNVISISIVLFFIATVSGLAALWIATTRQQADLAQCANHLKQIGLAVNSYHDVYKRFPRAVVPHTNLPPDKRLSWFVEFYPTYIEAGPVTLLDREQAWDAPVNNPPRYSLFDNLVGGFVRENQPVGDVRFFLCPANPARGEPTMPGVTHYVGIAGLGANAAELPLSDAKAGIFGYDRTVRRRDLQHGPATTIMATETLVAGYWTAGGPNTVRGMSPDKQPYFGEGGQFASNHRDRTNVLFADGSIRTFGAVMAPNVVEAMTTLVGDHDLANFNE